MHTRARFWGLMAILGSSMALTGCRTANRSVSLSLPQQPQAVSRTSASRSDVSSRTEREPQSASVPTHTVRKVDRSDDAARERIELTAWDDSEEPIRLVDALAEEATPRPEGFALAPLTLEELRRLSLAHNPTLVQAQGLVQQARGNWVQVGLYPNPEVGYNGGANNGPFDGQSAYVSQTFVTAHKLGLSRDVASCDIQRAQWDAQAQQFRVLNDLEVRYVAALGAQQQVTVTEELLKHADEGVRIAEKLRQEEQVSRADVLQARLQQSQTRILLQNAKVRWNAAWKQLVNVAGCPNLEMRPLAGDFQGEAPSVEWETAWEQLRSGSPSLHAARARASAAYAQVRREEVQAIPDVQVTGSLGRDLIAPQFTMYGLQVGVALPVFNRNQGNVSAATGELLAAQAEIERLELALRDGLAEAFQRFESARNETETYLQTILPTAQENLDLTLQAYEAGELDFLRVLTARRDVTEANVNAVRAQVDLRRAAIEIQGMLLTGGLDAVAANPTAANSGGQTSGAGE